MTVIIGCPVRNDLKCMQMMIESLFASTKSFDKLVFVDGDSTDGTKEYLNFLAKVEPKVEVIHANTKTPLEAYNKLFEIAHGRQADLLLTQTDVIFPKLYTRDWLREMIEIVKLEEKIGAVVSINGGNVSGPDYIDGFKWIGGWCTYLPFRTIDRLGGFDTNYPNGYGVDIDYTAKIVNEGWHIAAIDYWVDHHLANSREHDYNPKTEEMKKESALYFRKKWQQGEFSPKNFGGGIEGI